jgi:hypothetical protein
MVASEGSERRRFQRIPIDQVVSFAELGRLEQIGRGINLSDGGIRFQAVACEIELGDRLRLTFVVLGQRVTATGTVAWATEIDPLTLEVGIEFHEIDARGRALLDQLAHEEEGAIGLHAGLPGSA